MDTIMILVQGGFINSKMFQFQNNFQEFPLALKPIYKKYKQSAIIDKATNRKQALSHERIAMIMDRSVKRAVCLMLAAALRLS